MTKVGKSLLFDGLTAPVAMGAPEVETLVRDVLHLWPSQEVPASARPFASLSVEGEDLWELRAPAAAVPVQRHDPVNCVCDLIVEMSWQLLRDQPESLCLHAAGIEAAGRLILMPNARRAGKSVLSVAAARLGHRVFSDDFLAVGPSPSTGEIVAMANGIAPRLRLPLPENASADLRAMVETDPGPTNGQYKYLTSCPVAPHGTKLPIGAIVLLDRHDSPRPAELSPLSDAETCAALILQNFARQQHAGAVLETLAALTDQLPGYRLTYSDAEDAARLLHESLALIELPAARIASAPEPRPAPPMSPLQPAPEAEITDAPYRRATGCQEAAFDDEVFVVPPDGATIHHLNRGLNLYWRLLETPVHLAEAIEILTTLYPDIDPDTLASDARKAFTHLVELGLIGPDPNSNNGPSR